MKPKIVFFDCDGVLITSNTWNGIMKVNNISIEKNNQLFRDYYLGKISYQELVEIETNLLKKSFTREQYQREVLEKITLKDGAEEVVKHLNKMNIPVAIISSGEKVYVEIVAKRLGIKIFRVNTYFNFDKNGRFISLDFHTEDPVAKVAQVKEVCSIFNCSPEETFFVGDSNNDLHAFDLTKHGILYKSKDPNCIKHAWKTIEDLREIKSF